MDVVTAWVEAFFGELSGFAGGVIPYVLGFVAVAIAGRLGARLMRWLEWKRAGD